jgi:hypothetical protein
MFSSLIERWKELSEEKYIWKDIIKPGLEKIQIYEKELESTPAYVLAMGRLNIFIWSFDH